MTFENGLKFADGDVTPELAKLAKQWLDAYTGTFAFLTDLQSRKNVTHGQIRGVLNCMLAESKKNQPKVAVAAVDISKVTGYLTAAADNGLKFPKVRLLCGCAEGHEFILRRKGAKSAHPGAVEAVSSWKVWNDKFQSEMPIWYGRIDTDGTVIPGSGWSHYEQMIRRFAENPLEVAKEYGGLTGNCCFCGRKLTDDRSTESGYGPVCAKKYGLDWGQKEDAA